MPSEVYAGIGGRTDRSAATMLFCPGAVAGPSPTALLLFYHERASLNSSVAQLEVHICHQILQIYRVWGNMCHQTL